MSSDKEPYPRIERINGLVLRGLVDKDPENDAPLAPCPKVRSTHRRSHWTDSFGEGG